MKNALFILLPAFLLFSCGNETTTSQPENTATDSVAYRNASPVGGACEDCELMYVGMPKNIGTADVSPAWNAKNDSSLIVISGTVYKHDGTTPAKGVILYYYHTDAAGMYTKGDSANEQTRHGKFRSWVKTNGRGEYSIGTARPGAYPTRTDPAHIHVIVKEPDLPNEYWIDDFVFDDDPLVTDEYKSRVQNRAGSGILTLFNVKNRTSYYQRDIILGQNVSGYPNH